MTAFSIAMLYISALMGAGFVSGKEIYNFFGRYGEYGIIGIITITVFLILFALMIMNAAERSGQASSEAILCPLGGQRLQKAVRYLLKVTLFISFTAMLSAGASVLKEQLGINKLLGGLLLAGVIGFTAYMDIRGLLKIFQKVVPIMLLFTVIVGILMLIQDFPSDEAVTITFAKPNWLVSSMLYLFYNLIAAIPVLGAIGIREKDRGKKVRGGISGAIILGIFAAIFWCIVSKHPMTAEKFDLPMIYLVGTISPVLQYLYALIMISAIYCSASNCLYGVQSDGCSKRKVLYMLFWVTAGYFLSLIGFSKIVQYIYPVQGIIGASLLLVFSINFVVLREREKRNDKQRENIGRA